MTTVFLELTRVNIFSAAIAGTAKRLAAPIVAIRRRRKQQQVIRELRSLTDRELRDIGIHRTEILSIAAGVDVDDTRRSRRHQ